MVLAGIVAGGTGTRMKSGLPKQFLTLAGEPIIVRTVRVFLLAPEIDGVLVAVPKQYVEYASELLSGLMKEYGKRITVLAGGKNRNETLANLIDVSKREWNSKPQDILVTHDAVRPFVTGEMIAKSVQAMESAVLCTVAVPATDTVLVSDRDNTVTKVPDRSRMYLAQTPQTVRFGAISGLLASLSGEEQAVATDLCGLFARRSTEAVMVPGSADNIKITNPIDLEIAEAIIAKQNRETKG